jgi:hypothetical protein
MIHLRGAVNAEIFLPNSQFAVAVGSLQSEAKNLCELEKASRAKKQ